MRQFERMLTKCQYIEAEEGHVIPKPSLVSTVQGGDCSLAGLRAHHGGLRVLLPRRAAGLPRRRIEKLIMYEDRRQAQLSKLEKHTTRRHSNIYFLFVFAFSPKV